MAIRMPSITVWLLSCPIRTGGCGRVAVFYGAAIDRVCTCECGKTLNMEQKAELNELDMLTITPPIIFRPERDA